MINIGAMVDNWRSTPGAIVHPKLSKAVDAARAALKANEMTDITTRLRRIYVSEGANYVTEAADLIDKLRAERDQLVNDVHSCGPTCQRAGCVNRRLRDALESEYDRGYRVAMHRQAAEVDALLAEWQRAKQKGTK